MFPSGKSITPASTNDFDHLPVCSLVDAESEYGHAFRKFALCPEHDIVAELIPYAEVLF
jgi:hypothetical protein